MNNRKKTRFYKRVFLQSGFDRVGSGKYPYLAGKNLSAILSEQTGCRSVTLRFRRSGRKIEMTKKCYFFAKE